MDNTVNKFPITIKPPLNMAGKAQVHLRQDEFDALLYSKGYSIYLDRFLPCPCKEKGGGMNSFRRVGETSDKNSFIHPGFERHDFFGKALLGIEQNIPIIAEASIDQFLRDIE